jgi:hypothetical protein
MKKRIFFLLLLNCVDADLYAQKMHTREQLIELVQTYSEQVYSFDVLINFSQYEFDVCEYTKKNGFSVRTTARMLAENEKPTLRTSRMRQVFQNNQGRIENYDWPGTYGVLVYDSMNHRHLSKDKNEAMVKPVSLSRIFAGYDYLSYYRYLLGTHDLKEILSKRKNIEITYNPAEQYTLITDSSLPEKWQPYGTEGLIIKIDIQKNFALSEWGTFTENKDGTKTTRNNNKVTEWREIKANLFVPTVVEYSVYETDTEMPTYGKCVSKVVAKVDVEKSRWNINIDPGEFVLPIPVGTQVVDMHRMQRGITGQDDPGTNIKQILTDADNPQPINMPKPQDTSTNNLYWLIGTFFLSLIGLFILVRIWKAKKS